VNGHVYPEVDSQHLGSNFQEPRILYHNNGNGTFTDVSAAAGPGINNPSSSRGLATGDLWNEGRLSAVVSNMNAPPSLLVNQVRSLNHWITLRPIGAMGISPLQSKARLAVARSPAPQSNRDAIGARIRIKAGGRVLIDEIRSGSSFMSNSDMRLHFGLGSITKIDWIEIRWPSGRMEKFVDMAVDTFHTLREGSGITAPTDKKN
jgi:enediyne biosynthesis protein E4